MEGLLGLCMARMLLKQIKEHVLRVVWQTLQSVDSSQIQVRLIEAGSNPDALLEAGYSVIPPSSAQVQYAQVIQRFGIARTRLQRSLQIFIFAAILVELPKYHPQPLIPLPALVTHPHPP